MLLWRYVVDMIKVPHQLSISKGDYPGWPGWAWSYQLKSPKSRAEASLRKKKPTMDSSFTPCLRVPTLSHNLPDKFRTSPVRLQNHVNHLIVTSLLIHVSYSFCVNFWTLADTYPITLVIYLPLPPLPLSILLWKNFLYIPSSSFPWSHVGRGSIERKINY